METKMFVNLPVKDLQKIQKFFGKLGFFQPDVYRLQRGVQGISEDNYAMLQPKAMRR